MSFVDLNNKNILVTGGCGFIGSNFIELIMSMYDNMNVVNMDMMDIGSREFTPYLRGNNKYFPTIVDVSEFVNIGENPQGIHFDYIFHFAAQSHVDRSIGSPTSFIKNNVMAMSKMMEILRLDQPKARFINISTDEVYGHLDPFDDSFTEDSPLNPRSPYSASKASADLIANAYHETYGLDIITTRCCNNFGPHQHDEKFIPTVVRNIVQGNKVPVYGTGENVREWIHVDDHNKSILEIANKGESGMVYNIGSGDEFRNIDMIQMIASILYPDNPDPVLYKQHIEYVEDRKGHDFRYSIDSLYYSSEFDTNSFFDNLKTTVDFYAGKFAGI